MTASLAAFASSLPLQAGLLASQAGQLLVALVVAVAIIIVVGKFVLKLAWRLVNRDRPRRRVLPAVDGGTGLKTTTTVQRFPSGTLLERGAGFGLLAIDLRPPELLFDLLVALARLGSDARVHLV